MPTMASVGIEHIPRGASVSTAPFDAIPNGLRTVTRACSMDVLARALTPQPLGADPEIWTVAGQTRAGSVVALWRYPVKSMMGEELNSSEVADRGLLGDRQFAVVDRATGKVGGAKNPRSGATLDFRPAMLRLRNLEGGFPRFESS